MLCNRQAGPTKPPTCRRWPLGGCSSQPPAAARPPACRRTKLLQAQSGPDRGSVAALEAALGAINNILGSYNKSRLSSNKQGTGKGGGVAAGPSKLIKFSAKANATVPVKELLSIPAEKNTSTIGSSGDSSGGSDGPAPELLQQQQQEHPEQQQDNILHSSSNGSKPHSHHQHQHKGHAPPRQRPSWISSLTGSSSSRRDPQLPPAALARSLQAYLALPLEQYSVLDPRLITRLPDGADVEAVLAEQLAEQQRKRQAKKRPAQGQLGVLQSGSPDSSSSSSSNNNADGAGVNLQPRMRALEEQQQQDEEVDVEDSSSSSTTTTATTTTTTKATTAIAATTAADGLPDTVTATAGGGAASGAGAADAAGAAGAFLLRIPMLELLGVDMEPLLVMYVDIDAPRAQVKFHTNRLVVGDPRFDQEFKVDLTAVLNSKVTQPAVLLSDEAAAAAAAQGPASGAADLKQHEAASSSSSSSSSTASTSEPAAAAAAAAAGDSEPLPGVLTQQQQPEQQHGLQQQQWQRSSALGCKVKLGMTLRLPHPLSIVPGPLLSTAASLVAKLVMQALLPSFLELLATDYVRWASGTSTASRQAVAAGSLVAAGKQQMQQMQQG